MFRLLIAGLCVGLGACAPLNNCGDERQEIAGARCVLNDDCPRDGEVGVCLQDTGNERPCVVCDAPAAGEPRTQCFLVTPVSCT